MNPSIRTHFLGYRALVFCNKGQNRDILLKQLGRVGIQVGADAPITKEAAYAEVQMAFIEDDCMDCAPDPEYLSIVNGPVIALLGSDAPSSVGWFIEQGATSCLMKPIRSTGIFATLVMAFNTFEKQRRTAHQLSDLRRRLKARPIVCMAVVKLMWRFNLCEESAFRLIRSTSMEKRLKVEDLAAMLVSGELNLAAISPIESVEPKKFGIRGSR